MEVVVAAVVVEVVVEVVVVPAHKSLQFVELFTILIDKPIVACEIAVGRYINPVSAR